MLIHEVAAVLGIRTDTVRYYEREGLMGDRYVTRMPNGYRDYDDAAIERLRLLLQARRFGMSIAEIKTLAGAFDDGTLTVDLQLKPVAVEVGRPGLPGSRSASNPRDDRIEDR